jgi:hypothetical protein
VISNFYLLMCEGATNYFVDEGGVSLSPPADAGVRFDASTGARR